MCICHGDSPRTSPPTAKCQAEEEDRIGAKIRQNMFYGGGELGGGTLERAGSATMTPSTTTHIPQADRRQLCHSIWKGGSFLRHLPVSMVLVPGALAGFQAALSGVLHSCCCVIEWPFKEEVTETLKAGEFKQNVCFVSLWKS